VRFVIRLLDEDGVHSHSLLLSASYGVLVPVAVGFLDVAEGVVL
jgi:hypothetical protein